MIWTDERSLTVVLIVFGVAVILVLPLLGLLYTLSQRTMLESEADAPQPIPPQGT